MGRDGDVGKDRVNKRAGKREEEAEIVGARGGDTVRGRERQEN